MRTRHQVCRQFYPLYELFCFREIFYPAQFRVGKVTMIIRIEKDINGEKFHAYCYPNSNDFSMELWVLTLPLDFWSSIDSYTFTLIGRVYLLADIFDKKILNWMSWNEIVVVMLTICLIQDNIYSSFSSRNRFFCYFGLNWS